MAHLKAKQAGMPPQPKQSWTVPRRAINLMEALRRSVAVEKKSEAPRRAAPARKRA
jgi:non-homologous end joining protein Ku